MIDNDIFEDVKEIIGVQYISDIPHHREKVLRILEDLEFTDYTAKSIKDFMIYVFG